MCTVMGHVQHRTLAQSLAPAMNHSAIMTINDAVHLKHQAQHDNYSIPEVGVPMAFGTELANFCRRSAWEVDLPLAEVGCNLIAEDLSQLLNREGPASRCGQLLSDTRKRTIAIRRDLNAISPVLPENAVNCNSFESQEFIEIVRYREQLGCLFLKRRGAFLRSRGRRSESGRGRARS